MLYFRLYELEKSVVSDNILVPTFKAEYEYKDSQQIYDTIARVYYWYIDIHDITHEVLKLEYKQVFNCYYLDTSDRVQCDILAVDIVAYE